MFDFIQRFLASSKLQDLESIFHTIKQSKKASSVRDTFISFSFFFFFCVHIIEHALFNSLTKVGRNQQNHNLKHLQKVPKNQQKVSQLLGKTLPQFRKIKKCLHNYKQKRKNTIITSFHSMNQPKCKDVSFVSLCVPIVHFF
jgi:hypothetical protein